MKSCALIVTICLVAAFASPAAIRNGYTDINGARKSLVNIQKLLKEKGLSLQQREFMKNQRKALIHYIAYYELTEMLLADFRNVSPDLYNEIDTLKNSKGKNVDVYVRFVAEHELPAGIAGTTNLGQDEHDIDSYHSEYGPNTVAVTIVTGKNSLALLAHEFGHVHYQVRNLAAYKQFYDTYYGGNNYHRKSIGHNDNDESGKQAGTYTRRFHERYVDYLRGRRESPKSLMVILQDLEKQAKNVGTN